MLPDEGRKVWTTNKVPTVQDQCLFLPSHAFYMEKKLSGISKVRGKIKHNMGSAYT